MTKVSHWRAFPAYHRRRMFLERRLLSFIAMLIATLYYLFGRAEAATLPRPPAATLEVPALEQVLEVTR